MRSIRHLFKPRRRRETTPGTRVVIRVWETLEGRTLFSAAFDVTGLTQLRADPAFAAVDGSGLSVAVLDTGLFGSHPDIQGNFLRFFDAVGEGQTASTNPGTTDPAQSFDPVGEGHGTHVAGTVGSTNPEIGVATATDLIGVRVLTTEGERQPQVNPLVAGLQWVLANHDDYNVRVVNMSLGSSTNFNNIPNKDDVGRLIDQLEARGVTVVAASGNSYGGFASLGTAYPSVFSTIAVANTWEDAGTVEERQQITLGQGNGGLFGVVDEDPEADQLSASSQRSTLANQVAAPGTTIFSTWNGDGGLLYNTIAGTSMASPFVAGAVALMQDAAFTFGGRYLSPDEVLTIVKETADDIVDAQDPGTARFPVGRDAGGDLVQTGPAQDLPETGQTFDRINVYRAVQRVRDVVTGGATPTPTPTPTPTADTNNTLAAATPIPSLTGLEEFDFTGEVGLDGTVNVGPTDVDLYAITLDSPGFPVFDLDPTSGGTNFDPIVRLFDAAGAQITFEDDTGVDLYPTLDTATKLAAPLPAGTYFLGISAAENAAYNPADASGIAAGASTGDYNVTIGLSNPDPNGVVQGAFSIDLTNPDIIRDATSTPANEIFGTIDSDPNPLTADGQPRIQIGAEDVDFFEVVAPDTGQLTVDIDALSIGLADPVDSFVAVYDENLALVDVNDDENFNANLFDSLLTVDVTQGSRYFVAITTFQNRNFNVSNPFDRQSSNASAIGQYQAYFSFDNGDANGTVVNAVPFEQADPDADGQALGTIGSDFGVPLLSNGTNGGAKDVDFFTYTPTQAGLLQIDATGEGDFNAVIGLWTLADEDGDGQDELVAVGDTNDAPASLGVEITDALVNQTLFVSVTGVGNQGFNPFAEGSGNGGETGAYSLTIAQQDRAALLLRTNDSIQNSTPEPVSVGEPLRGEVGRDGTVDVGADDVDLYRFDSPFNGTVVVRTDTSDEASADTFLRVFDAAGNELAFNNNASDSTTASAVTLEVAAGQTYYFGVNGFGESEAAARNYDARTGTGATPGSEGHYTLTLEATETDLPVLNVSDAPAVAEALGDDAPATFSVSLSAPRLTPVTVNFATGDGSATAGADYAAASGTLTFAPGETSKTVTVPVFGDFDDEAGEAFTLNLSAAAGAILGDGQATATIANTSAAVAPITFGGRQAATFTDADGGTVSVSIKGPGTGTVFRAAEGANPGRIVLDGTTGATTLAIKGDTSVADIIVNGSLKSLGSKTTDLTGRVTVTGAAPKVTFDDVTGATLAVGSGSVAFAADVVQDLSLTSGAAVKSVRVGQWLDTDATPDTITTPVLSSLAAKGAFQAGITAGTIGKVTVGGAMSGSDVRAEQSIAGLTVGSIADSSVFAGFSGGGDALPDSPDDFANAAAVINALTVKSKAPGSFSNTLIAAANLGKLALGTVATANGGSTFGVAALGVRSVSGATDAAGPLKGSRLDDVADSVTAGDFVLRLL